MRTGERGQALLLVLALVGLGGLLLTPALRIVHTGLDSKGTQTTLLSEQYTRDAGAEYAQW